MRLCPLPIFAVCGLLTLLCSHPARAQEHPLLGFSNPHAAQERALETRFDTLLNRDNLRAWLKRLSARPHHVGSPYGKENAEFIAAQFRSLGYQTEIDSSSRIWPTRWSATSRR